MFSNSYGFPLMYLGLKFSYLVASIRFLEKNIHHIIMTIIHSLVVFSYYIYKHVRPYQFEPLKKYLKHVEEDCRDNGKTSNMGEYDECNLETQLLLVDRINLNSVKEWCTCGC